MSDIDLKYDPGSFAGPFDEDVLELVESMIEGDRHLDASYVAHLRTFNGGIPGKQYFTTSGGKTYRVGRFLAMVDEESELPAPEQPHFEFGDMDARAVNGVPFLMDCEGPVCRGLLYLIPFAALYFGDNHPDEMSIHRGYVDLLCFRYANRGPDCPRPSVVVWKGESAAAEYERWSEELDSMMDGESEDVDADAEAAVRYEDFTEEVAPDFDAFLKMLREKQ